MRVKPWGECILIILTFNGDCNQWWLVKRLTKLFKEIGHVVSVFFWWEVERLFKTKNVQPTTTTNTNLACSKLSLKFLNECCLGIKAKVQSLQKVGSKLKYKTLQLGI
jgi:hypothetical protein